MAVGVVRFSPHGGSVEGPALKKFTGMLGARFVVYRALEEEEEEEPLLVVECSPRSIGLLEDMTQWLDGSPPVQGETGDAQDPLPGLETPPCR